MLKNNNNKLIFFNNFWLLKKKVSLKSSKLHIYVKRRLKKRQKKLLFKLKRIFFFCFWRNITVAKIKKKNFWKLDYTHLEQFSGWFYHWVSAVQILQAALFFFVFLLIANDTVENHSCWLKSKDLRKSWKAKKKKKNTKEQKTF